MALIDPDHLLATFGVIGLFVIVFAETGLLVGFFLPGDSLLFTAGLLTATATGSPAHLPFAGVLVAASAGAVVGAQCGYLLGRRFGAPMLDRPDRPKLQAGVTRARAVLTRYGVARALVLARFVPVLRTVLNPLAGTIGVDARSFTVWQVAGGLLWGAGLVTAGRVVGSHISNVEHYLLPVVAAITAVSLVPILLEVRRGRASRTPA